MTLALIPGSFDPVTNGHIDLIKRAGTAFDQVVVAVGVNATKEGWLAPGQRVQLIEESVRVECPDLDVRVVSFDGLLADLVSEVGATAIVKGLRGSSDFESESAQAAVNNDLCGIETFLLPSRSELTSVSSSLVRELFRLGAPVGRYVPSTVTLFLESIRPNKHGSAPAGFGLPQ